MTPYHLTIPASLRRASLSAFASITLVGYHFPQFVTFSIKSPDNTVRLSYQTGSPFGLRLLSVDNLSPGSAFSIAPVDLWSVRLRDPVTQALLPPLPIGETLDSDIEGIQPSACTFASSHAKSASQFTYTWSNVLHPDYPQVCFAVTVTATALSGVSGLPGRVELDISVSLCPSATTYSVYNVVFPRFAPRQKWPDTIANPDASKSEVLAVPWYSGRLALDPLEPGRLPNLYAQPAPLIHPGVLSMQFFAYYNSSPSQTPSPVLFMGTLDRLGDGKGFYIEQFSSGSTRAMIVRLNRYPEDNLVADTFSSSAPFNDCPFVLSVLESDWPDPSGWSDSWFDACRYYRALMTADGIPWTEQGPMRSNASFSQSLKDTSMFLIGMVSPCLPLDPIPTFDHSQFQYWNDHVVDHDSHLRPSNLAHLNLTTLIYNWETSSFPDGNWGEWLPAQQEFAAAAAAVDLLPYHHWANYFLTKRYNELAPDFSTVLPHVVWSESGVPVSFTEPAYDRDQQCLGPAVPIPGKQYIIDARSPGLGFYINSVHSPLRTLGSDGLYLDALTNSPPNRSYNEHVTAISGRPPGGGSGWSQGVLAAIEELKASHPPTEPAPFVFSEGPQELYLKNVSLVYPDHFDSSNLERFEGNEPVSFLAPMFMAVYHDYTLATGIVGLVGPNDLSLWPTSTTLDRWRHSYAVNLYYGYVPYGGFLLSPDLIQDNIDFPNNPGHQSYVERLTFVQNTTRLYAQAKVRDYCVFGQRERDPQVTTDTTEILLNNVYLPFGKDQPFVYVNMHSRADLFPGKLALSASMINWSTSTREVDITIDPSRYGVVGFVYDLWEVTANGTETLVGTVDFTTGNPQTTSNLPVPALSARFFVLQPH